MQIVLYFATTHTVKPQEKIKTWCPESIRDLNDSPNKKQNKKQKHGLSDNDLTLFSKAKTIR